MPKKSYQPPKRKRPCKNKKLHKSYKSAVEHRASLLAKTAIMYGTVDVYYCHTHEGWHVGHRRWERKGADGIKQNCSYLILVGFCSIIYI